MPFEFRTPTITHVRFGAPFAYLSHLLGLREGRLAIKTVLDVRTEHIVITAIDIGVGRMGYARRCPRTPVAPMQVPAPAPGLVVALPLMV